MLWKYLLLVPEIVDNVIFAIYIEEILGLILYMEEMIKHFFYVGYEIFIIDHQSIDGGCMCSRFIFCLS